MYGVMVEIHQKVWNKHRQKRTMWRVFEGAETCYFVEVWCGGGAMEHEMGSKL